MNIVEGVIFELQPLSGISRNYQEVLPHIRPAKLFSGLRDFVRIETEAIKLSSRQRSVWHATYFNVNSGWASRAGSKVEISSLRVRVALKPHLRWLIPLLRPTTGISAGKGLLQTHRNQVESINPDGMANLLFFPVEMRLPIMEAFRHITPWLFNPFSKITLWQEYRPGKR